MLKRLVKGLLTVYKKLVPPHVSGACIYTPTCSMYMYDAVDEYGAVIGVAMGLARLLSCNPFAKGGFRPVKYNLKGRAKWLL